MHAGLETAVRTQVGDQLRDQASHGPLGDLEFAADGGVGETGREQPEHLAVAVAGAGGGTVAGEEFGRGPGAGPEVLEEFADHRHQGRFTDHHGGVPDRAGSAGAPGPGRRTLGGGGREDRQPGVDRDQPERQGVGDPDLGAGPGEGADVCEDGGAAQRGGRVDGAHGHALGEREAFAGELAGQGRFGGVLAGSEREGFGARSPGGVLEHGGDPVGAPDEFQRGAGPVVLLDGKVAGVQVFDAVAGAADGVEEGADLLVGVEQEPAYGGVDGDRRGAPDGVVGVGFGFGVGVVGAADGPQQAEGPELADGRGAPAVVPAEGADRQTWLGEQPRVQPGCVVRAAGGRWGTGGSFHRRNATHRSPRWHRCFGWRDGA